MTNPTGSRPPASTKTSPTNRGATILKATLVVGSIVATLLGADLAARQDQANAVASGLTAAGYTGAQFGLPRSLATLPNLPANPQLGTTDINALLNMPLAPIPSITMPAPRIRSRSSR